MDVVSCKHCYHHEDDPECRKVGGGRRRVNICCKCGARGDTVSGRLRFEQDSSDAPTLAYLKGRL